MRCFEAVEPISAIIGNNFLTKNIAFLIQIPIPPSPFPGSHAWETAGKGAKVTIDFILFT